MLLPSTAHSTSLVALWSLVVSGHEMPHSNDHSISQVVSVLDQAEASDISDSRNSLSRNATIKLFPASREGFRPMFRYGCRESEFNTITLETETCLSGDYYLSHNFLITEPPRCANGEEPVMNYWHTQGCGGEPRYSTATTGKGIPEYCLWGGFSPKVWSLKFHCNDTEIDTNIQSPSQKHQKAIPPPPPEPLPYPGQEDKKEDSSLRPLEEPTPGIIFTHLFPACNGQGRKRPFTLPVDKCLTIYSYGLQIRTPAVCPNGTRAKWARFEDGKCGYGELSAHYGLKEVKDSDIMKCLSTGAIGGTEKVSSMAFWCDGFGDDVKKPDPESPPEDAEPAKPKPRAGSVSESACMRGRAPFFKHPRTDTCVDLKTDRMKIYSTGVCANGTAALLARYGARSCVGSPEELMEVSEERGNLERCLDFEGVESFAFWCEGKGIERLDPTPRPAPRKGSGSKGKMIMVVMLFVVAGVLLVGLVGWMLMTTAIGRRVKALFGRDEGYIAL